MVTAIEFTPLCAPQPCSTLNLMAVSRADVIVVRRFESADGWPMDFHTAHPVQLLIACPHHRHFEFTLHSTIPLHGLSSPPLLHGLHLHTRQKALHKPQISPCFSKLCFAYSEHDGLNLQYPCEKNRFRQP